MREKVSGLTQEGKGGKATDLALARKTRSLGELLLVLDRLASETRVMAYARKKVFVSDSSTKRTKEGERTSADVAVRLHVPQAALAVDLVCPRTLGSVRRPKKVVPLDAPQRPDGGSWSTTPEP